MIVLAVLLCALFAFFAAAFARVVYLELRARKARGPSINHRTGASR